MNNLLGDRYLQILVAHSSLLSLHLPLLQPHLDLLDKNKENCDFVQSDIHVLVVVSSFSHISVLKDLVTVHLYGTCVYAVMCGTALLSQSNEWNVWKHQFKKTISVLTEFKMEVQESKNSLSAPGKKSQEASESVRAVLLSMPRALYIFLSAFGFKRRIITNSL